MSDRRPAPGSAWYRHCRDAIPFDWCDDGDLPDGFRRYTNPKEEQLIIGTITEDDFLGRTPKKLPPEATERNKEPQPQRERKQPAGNPSVS